MQALRTHVAGVDVHKEVLAITVLIGGGDEEPRVEQFQCATFTEDLIAAGVHLRSLGVTEVAMESTGIYWKPVFHAWEPLELKVTVGNATHIKNVPGRKTDMNDSHWIAQLHRFGLIRASFIPPSEFQRMRMISRHRTNLTDDRTAIKNRVQKVLEDGNVKFGVIVSDVFGVSGMNVLKMIAGGVTSPDRLITGITTRIKRKEEARKALTNTLTREHCWLIQELLQQYRDIQARILAADNELKERVHPYRHLMTELCKIPGIDTVLATSILAEASDDMRSFKDERAFAAWCGVAAGNNESAGKKKDQNAATAIRR